MVLVKQLKNCNKTCNLKNNFLSVRSIIILSWILRPKVPEIEDFGTNEFDDFEQGILLNKQSNDANIPVIYGERLLVVLECLWKHQAQIITYLYMAIVMSEGEINSIEEIRIDDKVVTFASAFSDGTAVEVG